MNVVIICFLIATVISWWTKGFGRALALVLWSSLLGFGFTIIGWIAPGEATTYTLVGVMLPVVKVIAVDFLHLGKNKNKTNVRDTSGNGDK